MFADGILGEQLGAGEHVAGDRRKIETTPDADGGGDEENGQEGQLADGRGLEPGQPGSMKAAACRNDEPASKERDGENDRERREGNAQQLENAGDEGEERDAGNDG